MLRLERRGGGEDEVAGEYWLSSCTATLALGRRGWVGAGTQEVGGTILPQEVGRGRLPLEVGRTMLPQEVEGARLPQEVAG